MARIEDVNPDAVEPYIKQVLDAQARKDIILAEAKTLAQAQNFELVEDQVLLDEVSGLVEWPVVLMGSFDQEFLSIPGEVIRATIRNNQKCFVVSDSKTGKLTNKFILTANIEASDGGKAITSFAIVTTDAAPSIAQYHNRMPVVLDDSHFDDWMRSPSMKRQCPSC